MILKYPKLPHILCGLSILLLCLESFFSSIFVLSYPLSPMVAQHSNIPPQMLFAQNQLRGTNHQHTFTTLKHETHCKSHSNPGVKLADKPPYPTLSKISNDLIKHGLNFPLILNLYTPLIGYTLRNMQSPASNSITLLLRFA